MRLRSLQRHWDAFGRTDPLWAVLTHPDKKGNRWAAEDFFRTGVEEIASVLADIRSLGLPLRHGRALDFGCGVGRLTQALSTHFGEVWGVDIAPSMIELARKHNRHGERCRFVLNESDRLASFEDESFDFIYSKIVLQHVEPRYARRYLQEFARILAPGGVLMFQLPSERLSSEETTRGLKGFLKRCLPRWSLEVYRRLRGSWQFPRMEVHAMKPEEVAAAFEGSRVRVVDVAADHSAGPQWASFRYCVKKDLSV